MSDAYKCDRCETFKDGTNSSSVTLTTSGYVMKEKPYTSGDNTIDDLCRSCTDEIGHYLFGEDNE